MHLSRLLVLLGTLLAAGFCALVLFDDPAVAADRPSKTSPSATVGRGVPGVLDHLSPGQILDGPSPGQTRPDRVDDIGQWLTGTPRPVGTTPPALPGHRPPVTAPVDRPAPADTKHPVPALIGRPAGARPTTPAPPAGTKPATPAPPAAAAGPLRAGLHSPTATPPVPPLLLNTVERLTGLVAAEVDHGCARLAAAVPVRTADLVDAACAIVTGLTRAVTGLVPPLVPGQPSLPPSTTPPSATPPGSTPPATGPGPGQSGATGPTPPSARIDHALPVALTIGPTVPAPGGGGAAGTDGRPTSRDASPTTPAPTPVPSGEGSHKAETRNGAGPALNDTTQATFGDDYVRAIGDATGTVSGRAPAIATRPG